MSDKTVLRPWGQFDPHGVQRSELVFADPVLVPALFAHFGFQLDRDPDTYVTSTQHFLVWIGSSYLKTAI